MDKNKLIRERNKLESKQEKLKTIVENTQNELNNVNEWSCDESHGSILLCTKYGTYLRVY